MPEGPQMVIIKEQAEQFVGQEILKAEGNAKDIPFQQVKGNTLVDIKTFGKEILFCFENFTIRIHLMLFGKYAIDGELNRILRLGLEFETGIINFYACECKFLPGPLDNFYDWSSDVLHHLFDKHKALDKLKARPKQLICEALLDQNIFAGVGNKIKNEVLFRQQVHPESIVGEMPEAVLRKLVDEVVRFSHKYLDWKHEGIEEEPWQVYKRKECIRDHMPLRKEKIGKSGRSCYFCDSCQQLYLPND